MHSTIYQIDIKPIAETDILRLDNIVAGEMASISYVSENNEDGRQFDIKCLVEHMLAPSRNPFRYIHPSRNWISSDAFNIVLFTIAT